MNAERPTQSIYQQKYDYTVLVLQGGGALGAYQAGVFEGLVETGFSPNWVAGVSIGSINGAVIAGNPPERRIERLRAFWDLVSSALPGAVPSHFEPLHKAFNQASALTSAMFGVPGFFTPRMLPAIFSPEGTDGAVSFYDTQPLRSTLETLVDFDLINQRKVRLSVGAAHVRTGNSTYFDNHAMQIGLEHIMASGALPPAFPPVSIHGEYYWDGGIVSNTPLWYVLDECQERKVLIIQVDLFSAKGEMPRTLDEAMERHQDIVYSSKTRFNTNHLRELQHLRNALHRLLRKLPDELRSDADVKFLEASCKGTHIDIVHLINRRYNTTGYNKDYEFSRATIRQHWEAGLEDIRHTVSHPEWLHGGQRSDGVRVYDLVARQDVG